MKKLKFSALAVLFVFGLSTLFVSCGDDAKKDDTKDEAKTEVKTEAEEIAADLEKDLKEIVADYSAGKTIYEKTCQACHQANGEGLGDVFPGLKGKACDVNIVTNGVEGTAMIAYKATMSDQEIANVVNYVNHSFDNKFDDVKAADVAAVR